jgi:Pvc16 N-terminal domain/Carboxypeptidase regulatory-like domain
MFDELDATLALLLNDSAMPAALAELLNAEVSFITPDKNFPPALTRSTVNLFLYEVKENRELRDPTPILEQVGGSVIRRRPPLRVDCSYIVTTWSNSTDAVRVVEEHQLLAQALLWLSRFPSIPEKYLPADWQDTTKQSYQPYPLQMFTAQMDPNKNAGEFWDALAISPRPAFYLTVTIAMDLGLAEELTPVTTRTTAVKPGTAGQTGHDTWVQVGGRVFAAPDQGIPNALIDIADAGLRTTSDADGRYSFIRVPAGSHTVRCVATGFAPKTQPVVVPGPPENYEIILIPL